MNREFKEGDYVRRKSGGPEMKIFELINESMAKCGEVVIKVAEGQSSLGLTKGGAATPPMFSWEYHIIPLSDLEHVKGCR